MAKSKNQNLTAESAENAEVGIIKDIDGKMIRGSLARYHAAEILNGNYSRSAEKAESAEVDV